MPDAQTLFIVVHGTELGIPANIDACLAGACPRLAGSTVPIYTSSTSSGLIFARLTASFMTIEPNFVVGTEDKLPIKLPIAVLTAETI